MRQRLGWIPTRRPSLVFLFFTETLYSVCAASSPMVTSSHIGRFAGQQCLWSGQHVAPGSGQHPQLTHMSTPMGMTQQHVVSAGHECVASHCFSAATQFCTHCEVKTSRARSIKWALTEIQALKAITVVVVYTADTHTHTHHMYRVIASSPEVGLGRGTPPWVVHPTR